MAHLKRHQVPKTWPLHRKGNTFVVRPLDKLTQGLPLLVGLRDMLGVVKTKKEAKQAIHEGNILINKRKAKDVRESLGLFDNLSLVASKKDYKLTLALNGKFSFEEIKNTEAGKKIGKIMDKKILRKGKIQININDGRNYLVESKQDYQTDDSVIMDMEKKKIEKTLKLDKGAEVIVFEGKHMGKKGGIKELDKENKVASIEYEGKIIKVLIKQIMVIN